MATFNVDLENKQFSGNDLLDILKSLGFEMTTGGLVDLLNGEVPPNLRKKPRGRPVKKTEPVAV